VSEVVVDAVAEISKAAAEQPQRIQEFQVCVWMFHSLGFSGPVPSQISLQHLSSRDTEH
jgi:hypothetical protein